MSIVHASEQPEVAFLDQACAVAREGVVPLVLEAIWA